MRPQIGRGLHLFHLCVLRGASLLVPGRQREEWWREWHSELWHVRHVWAPTASIPWYAEREVTAFCLGAFQDALCLNRQSRQSTVRAAAPQGSAAQCILFLVAVLAVSYAAALLLPGVRAQRSLSPHPISPGLVLIQYQGSNDHDSPTITPEQYRDWKGRKQQYFDGFAFYRVTRESVALDSMSIAARAEGEWRVAHASSNLLALLGLPVMFTAPGCESDSDLPGVILSERVWTREFGANPHIAGCAVHMGLRKARIVGVAPDGSSVLPGKVDAWLPEPDSEIVSKDAGYVVAHLTALGESEMWRPRVPITVYKSDQSDDDLLGVSLEQRTPQPWIVFQFGAFLALLALPAITSVSLGEYGVSPQRTSWSRRLCRWGFLSSKVALLFPIVYFASLDLAYSNTGLHASSSVYLQLTSSFLACLFGLRWVLRDQRQRCPVCLRLVTNLAYVGQASRTFLAWNGTEMMCMGGHTLLHVPGLPTSWFSTQRWLYLDTSWAFLFAGPGTGMENEAITGLSAQ